jgi:hypothetical protein
LGAVTRSTFQRRNLVGSFDLRDSPAGSLSGLLAPSVSKPPSAKWPVELFPTVCGIQLLIAKNCSPSGNECQFESHWLLETFEL